jgi:hypothetical protein
VVGDYLPLDKDLPRFGIPMTYLESLLFLVHYKTIHLLVVLLTPRHTRETDEGLLGLGGTDRSTGSYASYAHRRAQQNVFPWKWLGSTKGFETRGCYTPEKDLKKNKEYGYCMLLFLPLLPRCDKSKVSVCLVGPFSDCVSVLAATASFQRSSLGRFFHAS